MSVDTKTAIVLDKSLESKLQINFNVTLHALACRYASLDIADVMGTHLQNVTSNIIKTRIDRDGRVDVWNQCAARLTGFGGEEVAGKRLVEEYITDDYKARVQEVFTKALAGEETANFEFPLVTKGGVVLQILLNATTRRDDRGRVVGVVGIGQDITARMNQEQEYARLIDAANAPIFGIDVEGRVNVWNQCAIRLTGFDAGDVMGQHLVDDFITEDYKERVQDVFTKEKILAHCAKIDELAVRITRRSLFSRRKRGRITSIFKTSVEIAKKHSPPSKERVHTFAREKEFGCVFLF